MPELTPLDPTVDITVCIVNWNGEQWLPGCLRSLEEVEAHRLEVILVDNASTDRSVEVVRAGFPEVEVVANSENAGFAAGNNQAIRKGRGRHFFILNNDTILGKGAIERLVRFLDQHPRAGMVSGHLVNLDGTTQYQYYPVALPSLASLTADLLFLNRIWPRGTLGRGALARRWDPSVPYQMEQIPGACMLVRREAFESFGLFDESYHFWYEDVDLCARCLRTGWEIWYIPDALITHYGAASSRLLAFSVRSLLRFRNMLRYAARTFSRVEFLALRVIVGITLVLRLPLVIVTTLSPTARTKLWKGGVKAYLQLLTELLRGPQTDRG
ncbi:MAG: glycosyltransferase family 2 protein [Terriglobia bacterium]